jgi:hypothetical protein
MRGIGADNYFGISAHYIPTRFFFVKDFNQDGKEKQARQHRI